MTTTYLTARDVVATLIPRLSPPLSTAYPGVWVGSDLTADAQQGYARKVSLRCDGGPREDQVQTSYRVAVNCWAPAEFAAVELAHVVERILLESVDGVVVLGVESVSGASIVPDASTVAHVYSTFEVVLSGT